MLLVFDRGATGVRQLCVGQTLARPSNLDGRFGKHAITRKKKEKEDKETDKKEEETSGVHAPRIVIVL